MKNILFLLFYFVVFNINAQINAYAKVASIAGTSLSINNVNQTYHSFAVGNFVVIMQMQDNVIGTNTADNVNFGNLSNIASTGLYEIRRITSINGNSTSGYTTPSPTSIVVTSLSNTYNTGTNSSLQIISFRQMSATDYTTTANMTALNWNGNVGGVIAFEVPGTLFLNHNIIADGAGFRGGAVSSNSATGNCQASPYRSSSTNSAFKGEGIYKSTNNNYNTARAKILTGGGGGVSENGGGGGGGNYSAGGVGGGGWNGGPACPANTGNGYGGISLSAYISGTRVFMGGGGGGGQGNNSVATPGGNGGGVILIKANEIRTTGSCGGRIISANGASSTLAGNDGAGGGGAAGSIVFDVNTWTISGGCTLTNSSNGGTGGSVNSGIHGGGGAGGQGTVLYSGVQPTTNITTATLNGGAGCNDNSNPCTSLAGSASGSNNAGIYVGVGGPLPIQLISFNAELISRNVILTWQTSSEINNDYFTISRSTDGINWEILTIVKGVGNSATVSEYEFLDLKPISGISYYNLTQTDFDGKTTNYGSRVIVYEDKNIRVFPVPAKDKLVITGISFNADGFLIYDMLGKDHSGKVDILNASDYSLELDIRLLSSGSYVLHSGNTFLRFSVLN